MVKFELPLDPRLRNLDDELIAIVAEEFKNNIDLVGIHLRDARNTLVGIKEIQDERGLAKACILLAAAALESNLAYLSKVALCFAEERPQKFSEPQIDYLRGVEEVIDDRGQIVQRYLKQGLVERLATVPALLARAIDRKYKQRVGSAAFKKLQRTIERRDAITHPRWDKYLTQLGWWEAAEAIDAVELYLNSVESTMHPYMVGYFSLLYTIPGRDKHEVAVGHRTLGRRGPNRKKSTMEDVGILEFLLNEWFDSMMLIYLAFSHQSEGDSKGSMLTRAALVLLYAMLDAQLAVVSQWRLRENPTSFKKAEILFLNEFAVGVGHDGEVWVGENQHSFKKRVKAIPAILARRVDHKDISIELGNQWGERLLQGNALRNKVMHSVLDEPMPRVSKEELMTAARAVFAYLADLEQKAPVCFGHLRVLLNDADELPKRFPDVKILS